MITTTPISSCKHKDHNISNFIFKKSPNEEGLSDQFLYNFFVKSSVDSFNHYYGIQNHYQRGSHMLTPSLKPT